MSRIQFFGVSHAFYAFTDSVGDTYITHLSFYPTGSRAFRKYLEIILFLITGREFQSCAKENMTVGQTLPTKGESYFLEVHRTPPGPFLQCPVADAERHTLVGGVAVQHLVARVVHRSGLGKHMATKLFFFFGESTRMLNKSNCRPFLNPNHFCAEILCKPITNKNLIIKK